jgi:hypothetical protein
MTVEPPIFNNNLFSPLAECDLEFKTVKVLLYLPAETILDSY